MASQLYVSGLIHLKVGKMAIVQRLFAYAAVLFYISSIFVDGQNVELNCDPCINRQTYRIKAIVHGTSRDKFWQRIRASAVQAAKDMRVELDFDLYGKFYLSNDSRSLSGNHLSRRALSLYSDDFDPEVMAKDIEAASICFPM